MKQTSNYNLPQYEGTDKFTKEVLNDGFSKIDVAINDLQETFNINGSGSAITTQEVNDARKGKKTLKEKVEDLESKISSNTSQLEEKASKAELTSNISSINSKLETIENIVINVKVMGAKGDGVTDDSQIIKNCVDKANLLMGSNRVVDGVTILFPDGNYVNTLHHEIKKSGIVIKGTSFSTTIKHTGEGKAFTFKSDNGLALYRVGIKDITISAMNKQSTLIEINNVINSMFTGVVVSNSYDCFKLVSCGKVYFGDIIITQDLETNVSRYGFDISKSSDVRFVNIQINSNPTPNLPSAMVIRSCDGLYFSNSHWHGTVLVLPMPNETLASVFFDNCYFDRGDGSCISFQGSTTNPYRNFMFSNCYFRDAGNGVEIITNGIIELMQFTGCSFTQNRLNGVLINSFAENILFSGCSFADNNGAKDVNSGHLLNSGNNIKINGCQFVRGDSVGFGIKTTGSSCDITNNNFKKCNGTKMLASGSQNNINSNSGIISKKNSSAIIPIGQTEIVVTHGLNNVTSEMILVTPRSIVSAGFRVVWVDNNSFRILINTSSSTDTIFTYWIDSNLYS